MKMATADAVLSSEPPDNPISTTSANFATANNNSESHPKSIEAVSHQVNKPAADHILKKVEAAFDLPYEPELRAIRKFGTIVEDERPTAEIEKKLHRIVRLLEVILAEVERNGRDLTSELEKYIEDEGRQRLRELLDKHFPQDRATIERPDTPEALIESPESDPSHRDSPFALRITDPVRVGSSVGNPLGADQTASDGSGNRTNDVVKRDTNLTELTTALISERRGNDIRKAGSLETFKGEPEESSKGRTIGKFTANTEAGGVDRDATQYLQDYRPDNEHLVNRGRESFRKLRDRCTGLFRKPGEQHGRFG